MLLSSGPNEAELDHWLRGLAAAAPEQLAFVEIRSSQLLAEPLEVRGRLARDGDRLIRHTSHPREETQILSANSIELRRSRGHRQRFSITRAPELGALREALLAILDGDPARLTEHFDVQRSVDPDQGWEMQLEPLDPALAERVISLKLGGSDDHIDWLELRLADGEKILTRFTSEP